MYFVSIDVRAQVAIILLAYGPCVVIVNCWDRLCTLGRAPRTKETLPDFHEWCRVTRHPRIFCGLTGCQRFTPVLGHHIKDDQICYKQRQITWNQIIVLPNPQHISKFSRHYDRSKVERKIINRMMIQAYLYIDDLFICLLKLKSDFV